MVTITFPDCDTEKRALADQNIMFTVKGKTTYKQQMAAIRSVASASEVGGGIVAEDRCRLFCG